MCLTFMADFSGETSSLATQVPQTELIAHFSCQMPAT